MILWPIKKTTDEFRLLYAALIRANLGTTLERNNQMLGRPQCQAVLHILRANRTVAVVTVIMPTTTSHVNFLAHERARVIKFLADASEFEKVDIKNEKRLKTL